MPPEDAQLVTLLCSRGIGTEEHIRWHLSYGRALAHYHAIMIMDGHVMDYTAARHSAAVAEHRRLQSRARQYLDRTRPPRH